MSKRPISDAEAKRLVNKLDRRMEAISLLTGGPKHYSLRTWLLHCLIIGPLIGWLGFSNHLPRDWLLFIVISVLWVVMEFYNAALNRRIDAVVELLQQGGLLESKIPPGSVDEA